ncbi:tigger transposable element-derived protein 6-like [Oscarella lobularis]|uniref:tigger transposable element-derived protein 6-like n=1 Tax=Oscarella lobularis TaxID=121494 RepID=UPI0033130F4A
MNRTIWTEWLTQWNAQLAAKGEKILLLLDNASPHDPVLKERLTNITLIYLPKNSTSRLQPLDAGIIKNFKVKYRQLLLKHVLALIDSTDSSASSISKQVDVLTATRWAKNAWSLVKDSTIVNCFKHCGVPPSDVETDDPFADLVDEETEQLASLQELVCRTDPTVFSVEYVQSDGVLSAYATIEDSGDWRPNLRALALENDAKRAVSEVIEADSEADSEEAEDEVVIEEKSTITSYAHAILLTEEQVHFPLKKGEEVASNAAFDLATALKDAKWRAQSSEVQTKVTEYFKKL